MEPSADKPDEALLARVERLELAVAQLSAELAVAKLAGARIPAAPPAARPITTPKPPMEAAAMMPFASSAAQQREKVSFETQLGARVLSKVAVLLLLVGAAWFMKWAFENQWVGPLGRVVAGLLAGAGVILWSERFRQHGYGAFSYALKAVGTGVLYLSLWAAFQLYHLLPATAALLAMIAVTAWNAWMAVIQDAELLAGYSLLGAYLTPALLSTGGDHEVFLFTYLLAIALAVLALLRSKAWPRLLLGVLPVTAGYFIAWYSQHFEASKAGVTLVLALLLWAAMAAVPLIATDAEGVIVGVLTPLGAGAFGALAVYSVLADSGGRAMEPWYAVGFAAVYLALTRVRREGLVAAMHLSLGVVFLTVAIPLKANGRGITAGWLAEAVALLWVASLPQVGRRAGTALRWLAGVSLVLGAGGAMIGPELFGGVTTAFWNRNFATSMGAVVALGAAIVLARRLKERGAVIAAGSLLLLNAVLLVAMYTEIFVLFRNSVTQDTTMRQADFAFSAWMMLQGAAQLAVGFWRRVALPRWIGLVLLAATATKAFGYDMRGLSTGYRVASYLGLGLVLMAVSFAYQKDWLGLKDADREGEAAR